MAELTEGNNTIWKSFPLFGKSPPTQIPYVILGHHVRFILLGGGGGEDRWGTFKLDATTWYN